MDKVSAFFEAYEARFNQSLKGEVDVEGTMAAFADSFTEASPAGVISGKNDETFKDTIPKGYEFYRSIGTQSMKIMALDITWLNDMHVMAKVCWQAIYQKKDGNKETINFDVFYFLQKQNGVLKIFAYITGDEQAVLKERGLI